MKKITIALALGCLLLLGGGAFAELCTMDAVPAASLLLPYFEVDLDAAEGTGINTLFSINNASAAPAIAHVTVWTDWSIPVLDFDVYLTGYDMQSINMYNILANGRIPVTANPPNESSNPACGDDGVPPGDDPTGDECSPHGLNPAWDDYVGAGLDADNFCSQIFPFYNNPLLQGAALTWRQQALTGEVVADFGSTGCWGADHGDATRIARGYVTVDNVQYCNLDFPSDYGLPREYFGTALDPDAGTVSNVNQLWGDYFLVDEPQNFAQGDNLVHIEADPTLTRDNWGTNGYTYYSRYSEFNATEDYREPLGTTWAARYLQGGDFDGGTQLVVWRDSTMHEAENITTGYTCGAPGTSGVGPSWHPMNEFEVVAFNEEEDAVELCFNIFGGGGVISPPPPVTEEDPPCFPLETQKVQVGAGNLVSPFNFGWLYLNLNAGADTLTAPAVYDFDPNNEEGHASYVSVMHSALGRFSVGMAAIPLTSACSDANPLLVPNWVIPQP